MKRFAEFFVRVCRTQKVLTLHPDLLPCKLAAVIKIKNKNKNVILFSPLCLGREQFHFTFAQNLFIDQSFSIFLPRTQRNSDICYILAERKHFKMCSVFPVGGVFVCVYVCMCGGGGGGGLQKSC